MKDQGFEAPQGHTAHQGQTRSLGLTLITLQLLIILLGWVASNAAAAEPERFGLGRTPTAEEIALWDIDVSLDGAGLPEGSGSVEQGRKVYTQKCQACHGVDGQGTPNDRLVHPYRPGVVFARERGVPRTIGSYWPYATTVFDYIYRAMPFDRPGSLIPAEVYSVTAWLPFMNGIIE